MELKRTNLLRDDPSDVDAFGTHETIASLICDEITHSHDGRSIAIVGDWGSGKSTVIRLLKQKLEKTEPLRPHMFVYDAWAHEGDPLRRAFLDDLIYSLEADGYLSHDEAKEKKRQAWN